MESGVQESLCCAPTASPQNTAHPSSVPREWQVQGGITQTHPHPGLTPASLRVTRLSSKGTRAGMVLRRGPTGTLF